MKRKRSSIGINCKPPYVCVFLSPYFSIHFYIYVFPPPSCSTPWHPLALHFVVTPSTVQPTSHGRALFYDKRSMVLSMAYDVAAELLPKNRYHSSLGPSHVHDTRADHMIIVCEVSWPPPLLCLIVCLCFVFTPPSRHSHRSSAWVSFFLFFFFFQTDEPLYIDVVRDKSFGHCVWIL